MSKKETCEGSSVSHLFFDYSRFDLNLQPFISMDISVSAECADIWQGGCLMGNEWDMTNDECLKDRWTRERVNDTFGFI